MATIFTDNGFEEWDDNDPRVMAYDAINVAAHKIGRAGYNTSNEIKDLQKAMSDVLAGVISPEDAMSMLHYGETGYLLKVARQS